MGMPTSLSSSPRATHVPATLEQGAALPSRTRHRIDDLRRIRGEFIEMPGLTLTIAQAARLWHLDPQDCKALLERLIADGFLKCHHESYSRS
jgi:hypothetical protein